MRRSLFLAIYLRILLVMLLAFAPFYSVIRPAVSSGGVLWGAVFEVAGLAGVLALAMAHFLRRAMAPLQAMVEKIPDKALTLEELELQPYSAFDDLAGTIAGVSIKAQGALMEASESKRELEALLDSMQDAVVAVDGGGRIQWANQRMRRLVSSVNSGGASVSAAAVASAVRVGHALVQTVRDPELLGCVKAALDKREICERKTTLLVPGRIFEVSASPMPAGGAVAVLHDITRIEEVEQTQRDFVANVSHELRTPLTSISGYVETLLDHEKLSPVAQEFLGTILKNASRMSRLTEDLLTMARVESHETELHPRRVRADALVKDAVETMRGLVQDDEAVVEIGETTEAEVFADVDSMVQVLGNLIENGIKYGQAKGSAQSRVVVSARVIAEPVGCVEFSVRDFGAGISSVHLTRIFERFYRVDKARSRDSGGTGLGLAIARHMVEMQGGTIRAESDLGAGSDFLVRLPRVQSVSE
ncbi:MAG: ATP-binding protein [Acidobacteriaceae bacterium]|nr:ATP-binding protein [Acidobacteriaceae bacterium]